MVSLFSSTVKSIVKAGFVGLAVLSCTVSGTVPGMAASKLILEADRAKVIRLAGTPSTIIIGNPLYASVSVQGNMLIVQGKHFGSTNVIIMDEDGNMLAEMDVTVVADKKSENLTVYRRGQQESYDCTVTCESYVRVGDNKEFLANVDSQIKTKTSSATE